jgi:uncharacterized membrane protein
VVEEIAMQKNHQAMAERPATTKKEGYLHPQDVPQLLAASIGALLVGGIYLALPDKLTVGPPWLLLVLIIVLLLPAITAVAFEERALPRHVIRRFILGLLLVLMLALIGSLGLLLIKLPSIDKGAILLRSGILIWSSNVLISAVWYWEMDGSGPIRRRAMKHVATDFQFPQQSDGNTKGWAPGFVDYLFLSFCTSTAFSPADTVPLTRRAKLMMMVEAIISMMILALLIARSVNII